MELLILGSGGGMITPRPGCPCRICAEARVKGVPYSRFSSSMFLPDIHLLIDTPAEIASQLNREGIDKIDYIFYTHWHPDHTLGLRIVETMNMFWLGKLVRGDEPKKIRICAVSRALGDLKSAYGKFFDHYERVGLIEMTELEGGEPFPIGDYSITPFEVEHPNYASTVFLIESAGKRAIYGPCNVKPFPSDPRLKNPDLLILGSVYPSGPLKEGLTIPLDNRLRREGQFSIDEAIELVKSLRALRTVFTHLEEEWGRSYDDYKAIEEENRKHNIQFAYDSMKIHV